MNIAFFYSTWILLLVCNKIILYLWFFLQLTQTESTSTSQELQVKTLKSRVSELESFQTTVEKECEQLRKDKLLLVDHVSEIQRKVGSTCNLNLDN